MRLVAVLITAVTTIILVS